MREQHVVDVHDDGDGHGLGHSHSFGGENGARHAVVSQVYSILHLGFVTEYVLLFPGNCLCTTKFEVSHEGGQNASPFFWCEVVIYVLSCLVSKLQIAMLPCADKQSFGVGFTLIMLI